MNRGGALLLLVVVVMLAAGGGEVAYKARGLRNKNPGNIRWSKANDWRGQVGQDAAGFVVFDSFENGLRAMARLIKNHRKSGHNTVASLIKKWAPEIENNTDAYIASVTKRTGLSANSAITDAVLPVIMEAMIKHENGIQPITMAAIHQGVMAA